MDIVLQVSEQAAPICVYSRHEAQLASRFHAFSFLNVVGRNGSLAARGIFSFVPVWILKAKRHQTRLFFVGFFCTHSTSASTPIGFAAPKSCEVQIFHMSKNKNPPEPKTSQTFPRGTRVCSLLTFVTTMMVNTSPFLKGRSCSEVPLKLYLATHSVPCGQGACREGRVAVSRWKFEKINLESSERNVNAHTDEQNHTFKYDFDCCI